MHGMPTQRFALLIAFLGCHFARADQTQSAAFEQLKTDFPGVGVYATERLTLVYGKAMTAGETAGDAVDAWLGSYSDALAGAGVVVERVDEGSPLADERFTRFLLRQTAGGVPVYGRVVSVLVLNGTPPRVSYVGARLAKIGAWQPPDPHLDAAAAAAILTNDASNADLAVWSQPELLVYVDGSRGDADPRLIWRIEGSASADSGPASFSVYVDALTGDVLAVNDLVVSADVSGVVRAWVTDTTAVPPTGEGVGAVELNPVALRPLRGLRVQIPGGPSMFTDASGAYSFDGLTLPPPWTVQASLTGGQFVDVLNNGSAPLSLSDSAASSGAVVDFTFNPAPQDPNNTAQTNAFWVINETTSWLSEEDLDVTFAAMLTNVNHPTYVCNAVFDGNILTGPAGCSPRPCRNTAFSTWLAHEYGHYVHLLLPNINSDQQYSASAFAEGFADTIASLTFDDPRFGLQTTVCAGEAAVAPLNCFCVSSCVCGALRNTALKMQQYPYCKGSPPCVGPSLGQANEYVWGQLLSGVWWDIRSETTLHTARQLFVGWAPATAGGLCDWDPNFPASKKLNSAHPGTLIEILSVDDNDATLSNGTANYLALCRAFRKHNIYLDCLLDTNRDGQIDDGDLGIVLAAFGSAHGQSGYNPRADFNLDGLVNDADLGCLLNQFGSSCPEPVDCPSQFPAPPPCGN